MRNKSSLKKLLTNSKIISTRNNSLKPFNCMKISKALTMECSLMKILLISLVSLLLLFLTLNNSLVLFKEHTFLMKTPDRNILNDQIDHDNLSLKSLQNLKSHRDIISKTIWKTFYNLILEKTNNNIASYNKIKIVNKLSIVNKTSTTKEVLVVKPNPKLIKNQQLPLFTLNKLKWLF